MQQVWGDEIEFSAVFVFVFEWENLECSKI